MSWTDLDLYQEMTRSVCIYSPYTAVSCEVKAENSAGVTTVVRNIPTLCAGYLVHCLLYIPIYFIFKLAHYHYQQL